MAIRGSRSAAERRDSAVHVLGEIRMPDPQRHDFASESLLRLLGRRQVLQQLDREPSVAAFRLVRVSVGAAAEQADKPEASDPIEVGRP
jgi:hypothetical protein